MARVWVEGYGCAASSADAEMIAGVVSSGGHEMAASADESDAAVIVTCSVKDATAGRMAHRIRELSGRPLVVAGCMPEAERGAVERLAGGASLMGPGDIPKALSVVDDALAGRRRVELGGSADRIGLPKVRLNSAVGIVEIASGCMSECSFCQTKLAKGGLRSYRPGDVARQAAAEAADGCREVWLSSTDNGCYGLDIGSDLPELVRAVCAAPGGFMVRVGMMNPMYMPRIRDGLLSAMLHPRVYRFLHVPVQSGSDAVLRHMGRGHTAGTFRDAARRFRALPGGFTVATDVIVGYPTETEEDFEETLRLLYETEPDVVNASKYSARPGTAAARLPRPGPGEVARRSRRLARAVSEISSRRSAAWVGWEGRVLFTERGREGLKGRNYAYKPVFVREGARMGAEMRVRVTGHTVHGLVGEAAG